MSNLAFYGRVCHEILGFKLVFIVDQNLTGIQNKEKIFFKSTTSDVVRIVEVSVSNI